MKRREKAVQHECDRERRKIHGNYYCTAKYIYFFFFEFGNEMIIRYKRILKMILHISIVHDNDRTTKTTCKFSPCDDDIDAPKKKYFLFT